MKTKLHLITLLLLISTVAFAGVEHLLPKPQQIKMNAGSFNLAQPITVTTPKSADFVFVSNELNSFITANSGNLGTGSASIVVELTSSVAGAEFQDEAYSIEITADKIIILATTSKGAYWAVQTLWQLAEGSGNTVNACKITDWPAFRLRGYMHDVGRSFLEFDELKKHIRLLSRYKINTFHWHLTENQGWRLESKVYPQLNANSSFSRYPGKYYTIEQAKELVKYAREHGIQVIPEIDMPGHSEAFRKAMGHVMLTSAGLAEMKVIMTEACETFADVEWMHIGSDEVRDPDKAGANISVEYFIQQMTSHIRAKGKKIVVWRPGHGYTESDVDMVHMWSSGGSTLGSLPSIDSRLHYINHYDQYADVVSLYNSTIAMQTKGSHQYPGLIVGIWNDRMVPTDRDIVIQNAFYQSMLAAAERSWLGGGKGYFYTIGTKLDPTDIEFADWERRFLYHKANHLKDEPIAYVKQTNVLWKITDPFPNNGNVNTVFPPETQEPATSYTYNGKAYNTSSAVGAGIYLRHVWGTLIPAFYANPQANHTAYTYTYVYSPTQQTVGLQLEFQNYGRSEADLAAPQGQWDYYNSKVWLNGAAINPPVWQNTHTSKTNEITLKNENFTARPPIPVTLNEGWNKVLIKLPNNGFSRNEVRLMKWMFTFVFVTPDGKDAVDGLIYSPDKNMNPSMDVLINAIDKANSTKNAAIVGSEPGKYSTTAVAELQKNIDAASVVRNNPNLSNEEYKAAAELLITQIETFKKNINMPKVSTAEKQYWYSLSAPNRDASRFVAYQGDNMSLIGQFFTANTDKFLWKIVQNTDGTYNLVSKVKDSHINPNSTYNTPLKAQSGIPTSGGWTFTPIYTNQYFAIVNGDAQLNQTGSGQNYQIYNWGGGNNTTDTGCQYMFRLESMIGADAVDSLQMAIETASGFKMSTVSGKNPGEYSLEVGNSLSNAIETAVSIANNPASTATELRTAKANLLAALDSYKSGINYPIASNTEETIWYSLTAVRENRSVAYQGTNQTLLGESYVENNDKFLWKLVALEDGTFSLVNKTSETYISTATPRLTAISGTQTAGGWKFTPIYKNNYFIITSGTSQFNQGNSGTAYAINNWGDGSNMTDDGCQYYITPRIILSTGVENQLADNEKIWIENGRIFTNGDLNLLKAYNLSGQQVSIHGKLPQGVILVKSKFKTYKFVVK